MLTLIRRSDIFKESHLLYGWECQGQTLQMQNQRPAFAMALETSHDQNIYQREGDQLLPVKIISGNLD